MVLPFQFFSGGKVIPFVSPGKRLCRSANSIGRPFPSPKGRNVSPEPDPIPDPEPDSVPDQKRRFFPMGLIAEVFNLVT